MKKSARIAGLIFLAVSAVDVLLLALGNETAPVYIKPFLIPSLAAAALCALLPEHKGMLTTLLAAGMAFHWTGDVLLEFSDKGFLFFALGLGAFHVGHMFYLAILINGFGEFKGWKENVLWYVPILVGPLAAAAFNIGFPMTAALIIYAIVLPFVPVYGGLWALRRRRYAWRIVFGGLLFIFSDTLVAVNVFYETDFFLRHAIVIATYLAAEWLLVSTMVRWIQDN